jgi:hypothetical protein
MVAPFSYSALGSLQAQRIQPRDRIADLQSEIKGNPLLSTQLCDSLWQRRQLGAAEFCDWMGG